MDASDTASEAYETEIELVEAGRWQEDLIAALERFQPAYVYRVAEEVERLFDVDDYDPRAGSGLPDFIVCDSKPSDDELREVLKDYATEGRHR